MNKLNDDFLNELLKCCLTDKHFMDASVELVKDSYMSSESYRKVWKAVKQQYQRDRKLPTIGGLKLELKKDVRAKNLLSDIRDVVIPDKDKVLRNLETFIKQNMFVKFYNDSGDLYNRGDKAAAYRLFMKEAEKFSEFSLKGERFEKVFADFESRVIDRMTEDCIRKRLPWGIDPLDELTGGGGETSETTLFLGDSGVGKSTMLVGAGIATARIGEKVAHFQLEGTKDQCTARYDSAWTGALYRDMKYGNIEQHTIEKARKVIKGIGNGEIYVQSFEKFGTATLLDFRTALIDLFKRYGHISRVIIDYLELCDPGDGRRYGANDERFRQTAVARGMKNLAMEFNTEVLTATQSTIISPEMLRNPEFVLTRYNLSEDKGKIRPFDNFITINQTPDEREAETIRLFADKFREHKSGQTIFVAQKLSRARFFDRKRTVSLFLTEEDDE